MNEGRSKWAAGSIWLPFLPTVSVGLCRGDFRNGWLGTDGCFHFDMGKKLHRIWVHPGFGNKGAIQYFFGSRKLGSVADSLYKFLLHERGAIGLGETSSALTGKGLFDGEFAGTFDPVDIAVVSRNIDIS
jgi:hypothetical protein